MCSQQPWGSLTCRADHSLCLTPRSYRCRKQKEAASESVLGCWHADSHRQEHRRIKHGIENARVDIQRGRERQFSNTASFSLLKTLVFQHPGKLYVLATSLWIWIRTIRGPRLLASAVPEAMAAEICFLSGSAGILVSSQDWTSQDWETLYWLLSSSFLPLIPWWTGSFSEAFIRSILRSGAFYPTRRNWISFPLQYLA